MFSEFKKKGNQQANPAVLFSILTLIIVLYIITIPPDFRSDLLSGDLDEDENGQVDTSYDKVFLDKTPGYWSYNSFDTMEHDLASFNLLERVEAQKFAQAKDLMSKKTAFSKKISEFSFTIDDIENTDNIFLNLRIGEKKGDTLIKINGDNLKKITTDDGEKVVEIDKSFLKQGNNIIEFIPEDIGFRFWDYNMITITALSIFADFTDKSGLTHSQSFWLSHDEKINVEDGLLRFYVDCQPKDAGRVTININDNKVYSGVPDCQILNVIDNIGSSMLKEGKNEVEFAAQKGRFIFDTLLFKTNFKDNVNPTYFFEINDEDYDILQTGLVDVNITFTFVNDDEYKELEAILNGHRIGVNTRDRKYSAYINPELDIEKGTNVLELRPKMSMDIVGVEIRGVFE